MRARRRNRRGRNRAGSASWLALLAATSLGDFHAGTVRTQIRVPPQAVAGGRRYRLVVQSYDESVRASLIPGSIRPRGSTQRGVSGDDLVEGVQVSLVELGGVAGQSSGATVLAWVEPGEPDLEYDARGARPSPGSVYGTARAGGNGGEGVELYLDQRVMHA